MKKDLKIAIILGVMCFFLTAAIVVQMNTVSKSTTTVGKTLVEKPENLATLKNILNANGTSYNIICNVVGSTAQKTEANDLENMLKNKVKNSFFNKLIFFGK